MHSNARWPFNLYGVCNRMLFSDPGMASGSAMCLIAKSNDDRSVGLMKIFKPHRTETQTRSTPA
jgi:hypothetical protein